MALSLIVAFVYGGMVWGMLPIDEKISWEGHLAGFLSGIILAVLFRNIGYTAPKKYDWEKPSYKPEQDPFMQHFDEDGNFVPASELQEEHEDESDFYEEETPYQYIYVEKKRQSE